MSKNNQPEQLDRDNDPKNGRHLAVGAGLSALASTVAVGASHEDVYADYFGDFVAPNGCPEGTKLMNYWDEDSVNGLSEGDTVFCKTLPAPTTTITLPPVPSTTIKPPTPQPSTAGTTTLAPTTTSTTMLPPVSTESAPESVAVGEAPVPTTESSVASESTPSSTEAVAEVKENGGGFADKLEIIAPIGGAALLGAIVIALARRSRPEDSKAKLPSTKTRRFKHA